jgi:hypothetical protein
VRAVVCAIMACVVGICAIGTTSAGEKGGGGETSVLTIIVENEPAFVRLADPHGDSLVVRGWRQEANTIKGGFWMPHIRDVRNLEVTVSGAARGSWYLTIGADASFV